MAAFQNITDKKKLALIANSIRQDLLKALGAAKSGHSAGALGMADIFTILYFNFLRHDPQNPQWPERDRVVLSNGHICPVLYATLAHAGYFDVNELQTLRQLGSRLQGHPHRETLPGLETTSGPLGSGLAQAAGMALAAKMDHAHHRIVALTSDGEHEEGNHWEAIMLAAKYELDNLIQIIDRNFIQIDGNTETIMPLEPLALKYQEFNWHVLEVDGHNYTQIMEALAAVRELRDKPIVIIAKTVPGKGVSFMEHDYTWHGKPPSPAELERALAYLAEIRIKIQNNAYDY